MSADVRSIEARRRPLVALAAMLATTFCVTATARAVGDADLNNEANVSEWVGYGRTYSQQRFSPLDAINASNVSRLGVDWFMDLPEDVGLIGTPLVADGTLYFTNSANIVRAVSATTGELLWRYDPHTVEVIGDRLRTAFLHGGRGLAMWGDKIYTATSDGRLIAINRSTGQQVWSVQTFDPKERRYISNAPMALHGKIVVGNGGSEMGRTRGYVTAYDAETGNQAWRFYVVPGDPAKGFENTAMAMAAKTWTGEWWKNGGGGHVWNEGYTYDPEFNTIYLGTGNGTPYNPKLRSPGGGDNLFLSSIVALDADTGEYRWHYQTTPGEEWDYDAGSSMVLADLKIKGRTVKALLQAPKNGFFYVLDRKTGKLVSAEPYAEVTWASKVDLQTGRPVILPSAHYEGGKDAMIAPADWGAHSWEPMSFNPRTGLVYIPTHHEIGRYTIHGAEVDSWIHPEKYKGGWGAAIKVFPSGSSRKDGVMGTLQAWDPVEQKRVWEVPEPGLWSPGTLTTAGNLVFQGRADGKFLAYNATDGHVLWDYNLGLGIAAPPITYQINGRQYIALLVGWGGGWAASRGREAAAMGWDYGLQTRRLVVFSPDGKLQLPSQPPPHQAVPLREPAFKVDAALADRGAVLYGQCAACHGGGAMAGGMAPDLRASAVTVAAGAFARVVRDGALRERRMPAFKDMTDEDLLALRHYFRRQANVALDSVDKTKN